VTIAQKTSLHWKGLSLHMSLHPFFDSHSNAALHSANSIAEKTTSQSPDHLLRHLLVLKLMGHPYFPLTRKNSTQGPEQTEIKTQMLV